MPNGVLQTIAALPFRLLRVPLSLVGMVAGIPLGGPGGRRRTLELPVAGLDETQAQPLWFALRRAAASREEQAVAERWLEALQVCQVASTVLCTELHVVRPPGCAVWLPSACCCARGRRGRGGSGSTRTTAHNNPAHTRRWRPIFGTGTCSSSAAATPCTACCAG